MRVIEVSRVAGSFRKAFEYVDNLVARVVPNTNVRAILLMTIFFISVVGLQLARFFHEIMSQKEKVAKTEEMQQIRNPY